MYPRRFEAGILKPFFILQYIFFNMGALNRLEINGIEHCDLNGDYSGLDGCHYGNRRCSLVPVRIRGTKTTLYRNAHYINSDGQYRHYFFKDGGSNFQEWYSFIEHKFTRTGMVCMPAFRCAAVGTLSASIDCPADIDMYNYCDDKTYRNIVVYLNTALAKYVPEYRSQLSTNYCNQIVTFTQLETLCELIENFYICSSKSTEYAIQRLISSFVMDALLGIKRDCDNIAIEHYANDGVPVKKRNKIGFFALPIITGKCLGYDLNDAEVAGMINDATRLEEYIMSAPTFIHKSYYNAKLSPTLPPFTHFELITALLNNERHSAFTSAFINKYLNDVKFLVSEEYVKRFLHPAKSFAFNFGNTTEPTKKFRTSHVPEYAFPSERLELVRLILQRRYTVLENMISNYNNLSTCNNA